MKKQNNNFKNNKIILSIFLFLFLLTIPYFGFSQNLDPNKLFERVDSSVVMVFVNYYDHRSDQGSGVVVDERGVILTNSHLINKIYEFKDITILSRTDTLEGAIIFQIDTLDDIMFLKVSDYLLKPVKWSDGKMGTKIGDRVYAISSPNLLFNSFSPGMIGGLNRSNKLGNNLVQFSADVTFGSSGGALLNENGELVGIIVGGDQSTRFNFAIPLNKIYEEYVGAIRIVYKDKLDILSENYNEKIYLYRNEIQDTINLLGKAKDAFNRRDAIDAIFYYTLYLNSHEGNDSIYYERGCSLYSLLNDTLAEKDFKKMSNKYYNLSEIYYDLGSISLTLYINYKDTNAYLRYLYYSNYSISLDSSYFPSYLRLSSIYRSDFKDNEKAIEILLICSKYKDIGYIYYIISVIYHDIHKESEELKNLNYAIKFREKEFEDISSLRQCGYFDTSNAHSMYFFKRGEIYFKKNKYKEATRDFNNSICIEENSFLYKKDSIEFYLTRSKYYRALCLYHIGEYSDALQDMNWLISKDSKYKDIFKYKIEIIHKFH